jgi:hypothetical protein
VYIFNHLTASHFAAAVFVAMLGMAKKGAIKFNHIVKA